MRILRVAAFCIVALFLLALITAVVSASPIQADYPEFRKPYDTIVKIDIETDGESDGHGSGFILDNHRIVTAAHVAQLGSSFTVYLSNGEERAARITAWDRDADVAILLVYKPLKRSTRVECKAPPIGTNVRAGDRDRDCQRSPRGSRHPRHDGARRRGGGQLPVATAHGPKRHGNETARLALGRFFVLIC